MGYKTLRGLTIADIPVAPISPTTSDQVLKAWNISENKFEYLKLEAAVIVTTAAGAIAQTLDLEVLNEAVVVATYTVRTAAAVNVHNVAILVFIKKNNKGTITLRLGNAGSADVNATVQIKQATIAGID